MYFFCLAVDGPMTGGLIRNGGLQAGGRGLKSEGGLINGSPRTGFVLLLYRMILNTN